MDLNICQKVLQCTLQAGLLTLMLDESSIGLPDKFYLGGPNSVRGFDTRGIGPRDSGNSTGGNVSSFIISSKSLLNKANFPST